MTPKISIITVCFNSELTIKRTIDSVINQNYNSFEHLIIDGNSIDNTLQIIKSFKAKNIKEYNNSNSKLKYLSEPDNGISDAFNKGVNLSKGKFLLFLNSDDYLIDNSVLSKFDKYLIDENAIYCGNIFSTLESRFIKSSIKKFYLDHEILHPATFIGEGVFEKIGLFDNSFKIAMDFEFFLRARKYNVNFKYYNINISVFTENGISSKEVDNVIKENLRARKNNKSSNFIMNLYYKIGAFLVLKKFKN